jgi:nitrogen regulatory protein PII
VSQSMKFVVAIVNPLRLGEVLEALESVGAPMPTITEVKCYGKKGRTEIYRGTEYTPNFVNMLKMEIDVRSDQVDRVTEAIGGAAMLDPLVEVKVFVFSANRVDGSPKVPLRAA